MKASELRQGNLVNDEDLQPMYIAGIWPVDQGKRYNFIDSGGNVGNISLLSPIPLTHEILVKMGFENYQKAFYNFYKIKYTHILPKKPLTIMKFDEGVYNWMEGNANVHIYYVHQLQNLYFALTNTELNFTL